MSAASNTSKKEALLAPEMTVPTTEVSADPGNLLRAARDHRDAAERAARLARSVAPSDVTEALRIYAEEELDHARSLEAQAASLGLRR